MLPNQRWTYFADTEVVGLDQEYVAKLDMARAKTIDLDPEKRGVAFRISSGFRDVSANECLNSSVPDSAHCKGLATDLLASNSHEVFLIVQALLFVGINRIGIYVDKGWNPIHIHNDVDSEKPAQVIFIRQEMN